MGKKRSNAEREFDLEEYCGCGARLKYKDCHASTAKKFFHGSNGETIVKAVVPDSLTDQLNNSRREFRRVFGRNPYANEPLLWNKVELKEKFILEKMKKVMYQAGTPEELIYAYESTGLLISSESDAFSAEERQEFSDAVEEYYALKEMEVDPFHIFTYLNADQFEAFKEVKRLINEIAIVANVSIAHSMRNAKIKTAYDEKIFILASFRSVVQSIEFIAEVVNDIYRDECLVIGRSIIEHYFRIKCLRLGTLDPKKLLYDALASRTVLPYHIRNNGKTDFTKVVSETGEIVDISYSYNQLSRSTGDQKDVFIYAYAYRMMSNFVHRDVSDRVVEALYQQNLMLVNEDCEDDAVFGTYVCAKLTYYYMEEFLENSWLSARTLKDMKRKMVELAPLLELLETNEKISAVSL